MKKGKGAVATAKPLKAVIAAAGFERAFAQTNPGEMSRW